MTLDDLTEEQQAINDREEAAAFAEDETEVSAGSAPTSDAGLQDPQPGEANEQSNVTETANPTPETPAPEQQTQKQIDLNEIATRLETALKGLDKAHGNYGELKRELADMKKAAANPTAAANFVPNEDAFKDLDAFEMPELKDGIRKGVHAEIEHRFGAFSKEINAAREAEIMEEINSGNQILDRYYPDRFDLVKTEDWKKWEQSQNPVAVEIFYSTRDPSYIATSIDKYKAWKKEQDSGQKSQKRRLESAVAPRGERLHATPTQSERDEELAAFNAND